MSGLMSAAGRLGAVGLWFSPALRCFAPRGTAGSVSRRCRSHEPGSWLFCIRRVWSLGCIHLVIPEFASANIRDPVHGFLGSRISFDKLSGMTMLGRERNTALSLVHVAAQSAVAEPAYASLRRRRLARGKTNQTPRRPDQRREIPDQVRDGRSWGRAQP